jgi:hypothetical protein
MDLGKGILDDPLSSRVFYGVGILSMTSKNLNYRAEFVTEGTELEKSPWNRRSRVPFLPHFETLS